MRNRMLGAFRSIGLAATAALAVATGGAARADMMAACQPDIAAYCSDVSSGRGRIAACLFSQSAKLGAACRPEVQTVAKKGSGNFLVPSGVRRLLGSGATPPVPDACSAEAGSLCSGVGAGDANVLACLYSRSNRVSSGCSSAVQSILN